MIYLSFTSEIPNVVPLGGPGTTRYGNITIKIGDKTYDLCTTDKARHERGSVHAQYLRDMTAEWPVSQEIRSGQEPFYLPIEEANLASQKSIPVSITILEQYEGNLMTGNAITGWKRETRFKPVGQISQDVALDLQPLSGEHNGYEVRLHSVNEKIQLAFIPTMVLLDNPKLALGLNEGNKVYTHQRINSIIEEHVKGFNDPKNRMDLPSCLQMAKQTMKMTLSIDWRMNKAYVDSTFERMFYRKVHEMRTSPALSVTTAPRLKTYFIPDMSAEKQSQIESLGGIVLSSVEGKPAKIQMDSNQLKKEARTQLGIERFKFTFPNQKVKRLQYLEQHCDATVEPEADGKYLVTFPAHYIEIVQKVASNWEELQDPVSKTQAVQECKR